MAEKFLVESVLGGERDEAESDYGPVAADALAAALALDEAVAHPEVGFDASVFLKAQTKLVELQIRHFDEERSLAIGAARRKRLSDRLRNGLQIFIAAVATVFGVGVAIALFDAFTSRSVVVNSFKAPLALAARGLTGDVVATSILDTLQQLEDETRVIEPGLKAKGAWTSDIKVELPETGVSLGEVDRLLHERFGHDIHIDGDLVQTAKGDLALTVRGDDVPAKTFLGGDDELENLAVLAAEYIYSRSQPELYVAYLNDKGRFSEALKFIPKAMSQTRTDEERAELANDWGISLFQSGAVTPAIGKMRLEMALSPVHSRNWWRGWTNVVSGLQFYAADEERATVESRAIFKAIDETTSSQRPLIRMLAFPARSAWDLPLAAKAEEADSAYNSGNGATAYLVQPAIAERYADLHDDVQVSRFLAQSDPDNSLTKLNSARISAATALERGDPTAAIAAMEEWRRVAPSQPNVIQADRCYLGLAYAKVGRASDAEAVFKEAGPWSVCFALHGDGLESAGDLAGADRVWSEGLKLAPDVPAIYFHRGLSEMKRGDLRSAEADFVAASRVAPHFADPLKAWGDLLARQNKWREAAVKYDQALRYAPAWTALQQSQSAARKRVAQIPV